MELTILGHFSGQKYRKIRNKTNLWRAGSTVDQIQLKQIAGCCVSYPNAKLLCKPFVYILPYPSTTVYKQREDYR